MTKKKINKTLMLEVESNILSSLNEEEVAEVNKTNPDPLVRDPYPFITKSEKACC
jgi:hypothetical protein